MRPIAPCGSAPPSSPSFCSPGFDPPRRARNPPRPGAPRRAATDTGIDHRLGGQEPLPAVPPRGRLPAPCHRRPRRQPARRRASARTRHRRPRLGAEPGRSSLRQRRRRACSTPASATASAKTISRRRPIWWSRGSPARCRPARPATGASTTAPSRRSRSTRRASQPVQQRLAYGKPTIAAVGITRPDNSVDSVSAEIEVRDLLIAGLGDSVAAGEGNPDRPIALADEGFCFRRFLGAARGEYFRPSRPGYKGDKACDDSTTGSPASASRLEQPRRALDVGGLPPLAVRLSAAHRARARGREQAGSPSPSCRSPAPARPSRAACSARKAPATARRRGRCAGTVPPQTRAVAGPARQGPQADCRAASSTSCC